MNSRLVLTVDIGNTHTRMVFWNETGNVVAQETFLSAAIRDRHEDTRGAWWRFIDTLRPSIASVSCVAPDVGEILDAWTSETALSLKFVTYQDIPLTMGIPQPQFAGIDRLVNCTAAWKNFLDSCLVIDMGTAVTWDVVVSPGVFAGGVIAPGLEVLSEALHRRTALPAVQTWPCDDVLGRDTESCLRSGAWFGFLAQVEGIARRLLERFPQIQNVLLTGGTAPFIRHALPQSWLHVPLLTHEGLRHIALEKWQVNDR